MNPFRELYRVVGEPKRVRGRKAYGGGVTYEPVKTVETYTYPRTKNPRYDDMSTTFFEGQCGEDRVSIKLPNAMWDKMGKPLYLTVGFMETPE